MTYDDLLKFKEMFPNTPDEKLKNLFGLHTNCINKQCARCGQCCTELIPFTQKEVKKIKEFLKEHPEVKPTEWIKLDKNNDSFNISVLCPFLSEDMSTCKIYEVRPKICRTFKCSNKLENIIKNKEEIHEKSYYNAYSAKNKFRGKTYSTYELFYGDKLHTIVYILAETLRAYDYSEFSKKSDIYKYIKSMLDSLGRSDITSDEELLSTAFRILDKFLKEMNINVKED